MTQPALLRFQTRPDRPEEPGTEILIGVGARDVLCRELARAFPEAPFALLVDEQVLTAWRPWFDELATAPLTLLALPAGEEAKTPESWTYNQRALVRAGLPRSGFLVGVGGGATGDLCAFAAATYHRGVGVALVPTSLLAMVDASLGGKCGLNLPEGKNLVGAFLDARLLVVDPAFLSTLPPEEFRSGLGEILKYAVGFSVDLFDLLEKHADLNPESEVDLLGAIVGRCLKIKASIVESDPKETTGERIRLNLGHTTAHALETWAAQQDLLLPHGIAVSLGLRVALRVSQARKLISEQDLERSLHLLERFQMPRTPMQVLPTLEHPKLTDLAELIARDKKRGADEVRIILPTGRGQCEAKSSKPLAFAQDILDTLFGD
jgi:3-dehydroquinate synthetase